MNLTEKDVRYVADLANLQLNEEEVHRMAHDLGQVLTHMEQLGEVNTEGVEPMAQVLFAEDETATLRRDVPHDSLSNAEAVANAANSGAGYFKVPKVIER